MRAQNSFGEKVIAWHTRMTRWAAIVPASTSERTHGGQTVSVLNYRVAMRYDPQIGPDWRICWGTRVLDIVSVADPDGRKRELQILATEHVIP